jgi:hypothetical protein
LFFFAKQDFLDSQIVLTPEDKAQDDPVAEILDILSKKHNRSYSSYGSVSGYKVIIIFSLCSIPPFTHLLIFSKNSLPV